MEEGNLPNVNLDDYSGVLVGGGAWNVSDSDDKKIFYKKHREAVGTVTIELTAEGKTDQLLHGLSDIFRPNKQRR